MNNTKCVKTGFDAAKKGVDNEQMNKQIEHMNNFLFQLRGKDECSQNTKKCLQTLLSPLRIWLWEQ